MLARLIEDMGDGLVTFDAGFHFTHVNAAAARLLGYCPEDLHGRAFVDVLPDATELGCYAIYSRTLRDRVPTEAEEWCPIFKRWFEHRCLPTEDGGLLVLFRDVTERREAMERLRQSEAENRRAADSSRALHAKVSALVANLPGGVVAEDENRQILFANQAFCDLFSIPLSPGALIGTDCACVAERMLPRLADPDEYMRRLLEMVGKRVPVVRDEITMADGRILEQDYAPIWLDGVCRGHLWFFRDVSERKRLETERDIALERYALAIEGTETGIWESDRVAGTHYRSPHLWQILGYADAPELQTDETFSAAFHPEDRKQFRPLFEAFKAGTVDQYQMEFRMRHRDGSWRWLHSRASALRAEDGSARRIVGIYTDITARKEAEEAAARNRRLLEQIAKSTPDLLYIIGVTDQRNIYVNREVTGLLGYTPGEVQQMDFAFVPTLFHPEDLSRIIPYRALWQTLRDGEFVEIEFRMRHKDGSWRWLHSRETVFARHPDSSPAQIFGVAQDITARKLAEAEKDALLADAEDRADRDPLTGLFNRRAFLRFLDAEVKSLVAGETGGFAGSGEPASSGENRSPVSVALLDLNGFKFFNDTFGHLEGDAILKAVADALQGCLGPGDLLARLGGDEFAALFRADRKTAHERLTKMEAVVTHLAYRPGGQEGVPVPLGLSSGLALLPDDTQTTVGALSLADERLYADKLRVRESWSRALRDDLAARVPGFAMLDALVTAVDMKDRYTRVHSEDVLVYALQIADAFGFSAEECETLKLAALLHDIGKIGVSDRLLRQPGPLSEEGMAEIHRHVALGAAIVGAVPELWRTLDAIRYHHEWWDGSGYPSGMRGEAIPLMARILSVADAFSAMTTNRPYRKSLGQAEAIERLSAGKGTQWDPACVDAFFRFRRGSNNN